MLFKLGDYHIGNRRGIGLNQSVIRNYEAFLG